MSRGGKRPGSGAKPLADRDAVRTTRCVRLPERMWRDIEATGRPRGHVIEDAIRAASGIIPQQISLPAVAHVSHQSIAIDVSFSEDID